MYRGITMSDLDVLEKRILKDIKKNDEFLNNSYDAYIKDGELQYFLGLIRRLKKGEKID
jgi:hypothetical protein